MKCPPPSYLTCPCVWFGSSIDKALNPYISCIQKSNKTTMAIAKILPSTKWTHNLDPPLEMGVVWLYRGYKYSIPKMNPSTFHNIHFRMSSLTTLSATSK